MHSITKPRLAILGTVGLPARYGGFETLVEYLILSLRNKYSVTIYCSSKIYKEPRTREYNGVTLKYIPLKANGIQSILYDIISILKTFRSSDKILLLGVSGTIVLPLISRFSKARILTNIDGLEWKRNKWSKIVRRFLKLSEKLAIQFSDGIIADNKSIQDYVSTTYNKSSFLIPYGADHVHQTASIPEDNKYGLTNNGFFFTVCRIEPENNVDLLLSAYIASAAVYPYVFVGNWQDSEYGRGLLRKFKNNETLILLDPIYDQEELNTLRSNCRIYLHGHSAGGTNPSLVEAMYLGLPIIAFDVNYNRETTFNEALYFSDKEKLISILNHLDNMDIQSLAHKMKEHAVNNYTWNLVGNKYLQALEIV